LHEEGDGEPGLERGLLRGPAGAREGDEDGYDAKHHDHPAHEVVQIQDSVVHVILRFRSTISAFGRRGSAGLTAGDTRTEVGSQLASSRPSSTGSFTGSRQTPA